MSTEADETSIEQIVKGIIVPEIDNFINTMYTEADETSIELIVTRIIAPELEKHVNLRWITPPLHNLCSDLCWKIKKKIFDVHPGLNVNVISGRWVGAKRLEHANLEEHNIATGHDWLTVSGQGINIVLDPTYVQFLNVKWNYDGCKEAIEFCRQ